jgi:hypothetical protein
VPLNSAGLLSPPHNLHLGGLSLSASCSSTVVTHFLLLCWPSNTVLTQYYRLLYSTLPLRLPAGWGRTA